MSMPTPYTQDILDAFYEVLPPNYERNAVAAALRAAANQLEGRQVPIYIEGDSYWPYRNGISFAANHLRTIAEDLEVKHN